MHSSNVSTHGMAVAPHHLASQSALAILREGGSAIEAMVAAAAAIAVVYPHMNGLGGDGFHPGPVGYAVWAESLHQHIVSARR